MQMQGVIVKYFILIALTLIFAGTVTAEGDCGHGECNCEDSVENCSGECSDCNAGECNGNCACGETVEGCSGDCCDCDAEECDETCECDDCDHEVTKAVEENTHCGGCH